MLRELQHSLGFSIGRFLYPTLAVANFASSGIDSFAGFQRLFDYLHGTHTSKARPIIARAWGLKVYDGVW
jgi:hypothetical protein